MPDRAGDTNMSNIKLAELVKSDAEAFGYFEAARIAQKKRKLSFQQTYMMLFGRYPKII